MTRIEQAPSLSNMLEVEVSLPSGVSKTLSLPQSSKVGDLKVLAQEWFEKPFLRFATAEGQILANPAESIQAAGL